MFIVGDKRGFSFPFAMSGKESSETLAQIDGMGNWQFVPCLPESVMTSYADVSRAEEKWKEKVVLASRAAQTLTIGPSRSA